MPLALLLLLLTATSSGDSTGAAGAATHGIDGAHDRGPAHHASEAARAFLRFMQGWKGGSQRLVGPGVATTKPFAFGRKQGLRTTLVDDAAATHPVLRRRRWGGWSAARPLVARAPPPRKAPRIENAVAFTQSCGPRAADPRKWRAFVDVVEMLNRIRAAYSLVGGTMLGWWRDCDLTDSDHDFAVDAGWHLRNPSVLSLAVGAHPRLKLVSFLGDADKWGHEWSLVHRHGKRKPVMVDIFFVDWPEPDAARFSLRLMDGPLKKVRGRFMRAFKTKAECTIRATGWRWATWAGTHFRVLTPVVAGLVSAYGAGWDRPYPTRWRWDVSPFDIGACRKPSHPLFSGRSDAAVLRANISRAMSDYRGMWACKGYSWA